MQLWINKLSAGISFILSAALAPIATIEGQYRVFKDEVQTNDTGHSGF